MKRKYTRIKNRKYPKGKIGFETLINTKINEECIINGI